VAWFIIVTFGGAAFAGLRRSFFAANQSAQIESTKGSCKPLGRKLSMRENRRARRMDDNTEYAWSS
jgi:hypothetical protein